MSMQKIEIAGVEHSVASVVAGQALVRDAGSIDDAYWVDAATGRVTVPPLSARGDRQDRGYAVISRFAQFAHEGVAVAMCALASRPCWVGSKPAVVHPADRHVCFDRAAHDYQHCPHVARDLREHGESFVGFAA